MAIYGENELFEVVRCDDEAGWLAERGKGVGGSDVAAVLGISTWKSPIGLWCEKTGRTEPADLSGVPVVEFGNVMEPLVGRWYADAHPGSLVRRVNGMLRSLSRPWAQASLDYEVRDPDLGWGVLEIKTARSRSAWVDGVPSGYVAQVTHYLCVTGRPFADVAVFFRDSCEYAEYRVEPDDEDLAYVRDKVDEFWHHVEDGTPPETFVGTPDESKAIHRMYVTADDEMPFKEAERADRLAETVASLTPEIKRLTEKKTKASDELKAMIGEHRGVLTTGHVVTWSRSEKRDSGLRVKVREDRNGTVGTDGTGDAAGKAADGHTGPSF